MSSCGVFVCGWLKANLPPEKLRSNFTAYDEEVETRKLFNECVERAILLEFILSTCGTAHASALLPELQQALRTDSENRVLATERWRRSVRAHMAATRALRAAILGKRSALHSDWLAHMEDNNVMLDTELSSLEAWRNGMRDALRRGFGLDD